MQDSTSEAPSQPSPLDQLVAAMVRRIDELDELRLDETEPATTFGFNDR
jgi:hypothetical protein